MILLVSRIIFRYINVISKNFIFRLGLFNLRGSDQTNSPFFASYAIISPNENILYVDISKITDEIKTFVSNEGTTLTYQPYTSEDFLSGIRDLVSSTSGNILVPYSATATIYNEVPNDRMIQNYSPTEKAKSIKNDVEIAGMVASSRRDSIAIIQFLHWLEQEIEINEVRELDCSDKLLQFRRYAYTSYII